MPRGTSMAPLRRVARRAGVGAALALLVTAAPAVAQSKGPTTSATKGRVITDEFWSYALGTNKKVVIYLPPGYDGGTTRYPVAYYLHGWSGAEFNWTKSGKLDAAADSVIAAGGTPMIAVMPDGDDSWWTTAAALPDVPGCRRTLPSYAGDADTYCVPWPHYDDYIAYDLVKFIDGKYRTMASREHRGLAGLSMGGYGAVTLALQYPTIFSAAASHSGVLWPLEYAPDAALRRAPGVPDSTWKRLRTDAVRRSMRSAFGSDTIGWFSRDPVHLLDRARARKAPIPALKADVGVDDYYVHENRAFRDALAKRRVPLVYNEYPGNHDWKFWSGHAGESYAWLGSKLR